MRRSARIQRAQVEEDKDIWTRARKSSSIIVLSSASSESDDSDNNIKNIPKINDENVNCLNKCNMNTPKKRRATRRSSNVSESSPPKQQCASSPSISLEQINLNTQSSYQHARRVLSSAQTKQLPGREQQLEQLRKFLDTHVAQQTSASLYISGPPGTGKTACLSQLLNEPQYARKLQCVYINCTSIATVGSIYKKIHEALNLKSAKSNESGYLAAIKAYLLQAKQMLLLVLDEIDQLCTQRQQVLYTIFEWPALEQARLLLIGIANSLDLTDRSLVRLKAHCKLQPQLMNFPPYTKAQIMHIFEARLAEVNVLHLFPKNTLTLLAGKVSALSGDVRRALDIGRRVIGLAEQHNKKLNLEQIEKCLSEEGQEEEQVKPVQVAQVAQVLQNVYGASQNLQDDLEAAFPLQQKLMLCSVMLIMRHEKVKDIGMSHLHEVYRRVCQKRNIIALDHTEFFSLVELVDSRGILRVARKKEPRMSRVSLQWDEEEVNGALCDKELIATILNDRSCLTKC